MALRRVTIEMPSDVLVQQGVVPRVFFDHNESVEILRVYAFQPRERLLLVRVLRSGPRRTADELLAARDSLRRRYHLRDFEILRVEDGGSAYISLLRQRNPGVLEALVEEFGAGVTPTTPSVIGREVATLSFLADDDTAKRVFALLDGVGVRWRLRSRRAIRHGGINADDGLTSRQREILSLAWNLGYFDIPARTGLEKLGELTDVGLRLAVGYMRQRPEQAIDVLKPIVPANPFRLVSAIVDVPDDPIWRLRDAGVALMPKSGGGGGGGEGVAEASFDRGPSPAPFTAET